MGKNLKDDDYRKKYDNQRKSKRKSETSYFTEGELLELAKMVVNFYSRSFKGRDREELYIIPRKVNGEDKVFLGESEKFVTYSRKEEKR